VVVRASRERDEVSAEFLLGSEGVVRAAAQREVFLRVRAALGEGPQVVELEAVRFPAAPARGVGIRAAPLVALEDGAPDGRGDVSTAPALRAPRKKMINFDQLQGAIELRA
jgi:hypothetical protein